MAVDVGELAPDFELKNQFGETIKLSDFRGEKNVVLIFYPKAFTGLCTAELCAIRDDKQDFVSDDVVHRVVDYLRAQGEPNYIDGLLEGGVLEGEADAAALGEIAGGNGEADPMYDQAVAIVLQHRRASISLVQRHLRIGYNRAARLLEQMEKSGLVTAMASNGNRELIVPKRDE